MFALKLSRKGSTPEGSPLQRADSPKSLIVGVGPVCDETVQNYRIQMAVNRYNSKILPPFRQFTPAAYRCSMLPSKSPSSEDGAGSLDVSQRNMLLARPRRFVRRDDLAKIKMSDGRSLEQVYLRHNLSKPSFLATDIASASERKTPIAPEQRYSGPNQFPTCFLSKTYSREPPKYNILSQLKAQSPGLPVSRVLDDTSDKYSDLKCTRSVLDVLQDLSRKRIHGKDEPEESGKRRCKGLGGDMLQDGEQPLYKPLFIPKSKIPFHQKKDQMTQTLESNGDGSINSSTTDDPKLELRKKLARQNNEIFASLSSSLRAGQLQKRKRVAVETPVVNGVDKKSKKVKVTEAMENCPKPSLIENELPLKKAIKSPEKSPKSPPVKDRFMTIYHDLQDSKDVKLNAIMSLNSSPCEKQFVRPAGSENNEDVTPKAETTKVSFERPCVTSPTLAELVKQPLETTPKFVTQPSNLSPILSVGKEAPTTKLYGMPAVLTTASTTMPVIKATQSSPSTTFALSPSSAPFSFGLKSPTNAPSAVIKDNSTISAPLSPTPSFFIQKNQTIPTTTTDISTSAGTQFTIGNKTVTTAALSSPSSEKIDSIRKNAPTQSNADVSSTPVVPWTSPLPNFKSDTQTAGISPTFKFGSSATSSTNKIENTEAKEATKSFVPVFGKAEEQTTEKAIGFSLDGTKPPATSSTAQPLIPASSAFNFAANREGNVFSRLGAKEDTQSNPFSFGSKENAAVLTSTLSSIAPTFSTPSTTSPSYGSLSGTAIVGATATSSLPSFSFSATTPKLLTNPTTAPSSMPSFGLSGNSLGQSIITTSATSGAFNFSANTAISSTATVGQHFKFNETNSQKGSDSSIGSGFFSTAATTAAALPMFGQSTTTTASSMSGTGLPATSTALKPSASVTVPTSIFGQNTTTSPSLSSVLMFGQTTSTPSSVLNTVASPTAAPLFGQTTALTTSSPMFGQTSLTSIQATTFGKAASSTAPETTVGLNKVTTASSIMFGQSTITSLAPSVYGTTAPSTSATTMFGQTAPTTSATNMFGPAASPATSATNMFGSTASPATTASIMFGITSPTTAAPAIFGQPTTTQAAIFGQPSSTMFGQNSTTVAPTAFGQPSSTSVSSTMFGQNSTAAAPSAFGQPTSAAQSTLFGQPASSTPAFGQASATSAPSVFGQPTATSSQATSFGGGNNLTDKKPFAFGQSIGTTGFGSSSSSTLTFGAPASNPPAFGPVTTSTPSFGSAAATPTFGATTTTSALSFGQNSSTFSFGNSNGTSFGQPAVTTNSATQPSFNFGATSAPGGGGFGQSQNQPIPSFGMSSAQPFQFGATTSTPTPSATSTFSFGKTSTSSSQTQPFGFGSAQNQPPAYSSNAASTAPPFGTPASTPAFGTTAAAPFAFGAAQPNKPVFNFGSPAPSPQQQSAPAPFAFGTGSASGASSGFNFSSGSTSTSGGFNFSGVNSPSFGQSATPSPAFGTTPGTAAFSSPFGQTPSPGGFTVPGTFSIGSGSSQNRARSSARVRRRP